MQTNLEGTSLSSGMVPAADSDGLLDGLTAPVPEYFARKAWMTRVVGAVLLVIASPIILILALLVYCTSRGPGIFRQRRVGKNGEEFTMFKIRTMCKDAEKESGPVWSKPNDPRYCRIGKMLRFLHLDELPQLLNVARGEMDLVGPRPERPELIDDLIKQIPGYHMRHRVLPGITGLAQIHLSSDVDIDSVRCKLVLDDEYIQMASLNLDVRILCCTAFRMMGVRHGYSVRWFGLDKPVLNSAAYRVDPIHGAVDITDIVRTETPSGLANTVRKINGVSVPSDSIDKGLFVARDSITGESAASPPSIGRNNDAAQRVSKTRADTMDDQTNAVMSETNDLTRLLNHPK